MITLTDEYLIEHTFSETEVEIPYEDYTFENNINSSFNTTTVFITTHNFDKLQEHKYITRVLGTGVDTIYLLRNCYFDIPSIYKEAITMIQVSKHNDTLHKVIYISTKYRMPKI